MAVLGELEALTQRHFMPVIVNQIFLKSPVLARIFKTAREGQFGLALPSFDGRSIVEPLETARVGTAAGDVGAYGKSDTWTFGQNQVVDGADFAWKMYHSSLQIHNLDVASNEGRNKIFDIAAVKMRSAVSTLREEMIKDFYRETADGSDEMVGFAAMAANDVAAPSGIDLGAGTVGGIEKTANAFWKGNVTPGSTPGTEELLTWARLNRMYYLTKKRGRHDKATLIVGSEGALQQYEDSITKTTDASPLVQPIINAAAAPKVIDGGFEAWSFKRIPMVADPYLDDLGAGFSNRLYFINENYVHWRVLKNFTMAGWTQLRHQGTDAAVNTIYGYGALTTSACNKQGVILDVLDDPLP